MLQVLDIDHLIVHNPNGSIADLTSQIDLEPIKQVATTVCQNETFKIEFLWGNLNSILTMNKGWIEPETSKIMMQYLCLHQMLGC